eukprot:4780192-Amphidinium_carterae.1
MFENIDGISTWQTQAKHRCVSALQRTRCPKSAKAPSRSVHTPQSVLVQGRFFGTCSLCKTPPKK